jgi:putative molybdopterin biosynthesis protein
MGRRTGTDDLENRVRALREAAGLSQGELANRAGITRQAVSAIESGGYVPNTAVALRLSQALGCSVEDLFRINDISLKLRVSRGTSIGDWEDQGNQRVQLARVGEDVVALPLSGLDGFQPADAVTRAAAFDVTDRISSDSAHGDVASSLSPRSSEQEYRRREINVDLLVEPEIPERTVLVLGCDPSLGLLAEHVHRASREARVLWRHAGSVAALRALRAGEAHIAGTHLWDPETGESNLPVIRRELAGIPVMVIALSQWQQGLMISPGNPKGVFSVTDLARSDVTIVNRESGSGSRVLLDHHLLEAGVKPEWVTGYDRLRRSHAEIAAAVRDGLAEAGPGILATARASGLEFIPLQEERYDLVVPATFLDHRPVRALLDTLTGRGYRREIDTLGGYDSTITGTTIAEIGA